MDGAIANISKAIDVHPKEESYYFRPAFARQDKGDLKAAAEDFAKCLDLNRNDPLAYFNTACINVLLGKNDVADENFGRVVDLWPEWQTKIDAEKEYMKKPASIRSKGKHSSTELLRGRDEGTISVP